MNKRTFGLLALVLLGTLSCDMGNVAGLVGGVKPTPAANVNVIVNLTVPLDDSTVPLNTSTAIQAEGLSTQPVTTLELWVDGALFASKTVPQSGQKQFFASWGWMPTAAGDHTLFVRAGDATHPSVDSNPVHVTASADANSTIAVNYPVKPGDTTQSVAQQFQSTPQQIIDLNPQINPSNPITPGLTISVPLPMPEIPATPISTTLPSAPPLPPPPPAGGASAPSAPSAPSSPSSASIKLGNAKLVPTVPMIGVYCYLSVDGAPGVRVPATGFIANNSGAFDLTSSLPPLTVSPGQKTITLVFDCWGFSSGSPPAVLHLGRATTTIDPSQPNAPLTLTGDMFKLNALLPNLSPAVRLALAGLSGPTPFIYPPTNVMETGDPAVCGSHMNPITALAAGGNLCAVAINDHNLVLVWDWPSNPSPTYVDVNHPEKQYDVIKDIDGYRVYEDDYFFQHKLVAATNVGSDEKVKIFSLPAKPGTSGNIFLAIRSAQQARCFVVRAYKGNVESTDSNAFCLTGDIPGTETAYLFPTRFNRVGVRYDHVSPVCDPYILVYGKIIPDADTEVGFTHLLKTGCVHQNAAFRGLVQFNEKKLPPGIVYHADLRFVLKDTVYGDNVDNDDKYRPVVPHQHVFNMSCASELWTVTDDWSRITDSLSENGNTLVHGDFLWDLRRDKTSFNMDVTGAVQQWQYSGTDIGFMLKGYSEDTGGEDNDLCMSGYDNFQLYLTFFPK